MKTKTLVVIGAALIIIVAVLAACGKKNDGKTGLFVYVTDSEGNTILDADGNPMTEEWVTDVLYATDENGETYTDANGEKVTVKQTRPVLTKVIRESVFSVDENGRPVKDNDGKYIKVPMTVEASRVVTAADGKKVTVAVTDKNGENVTGEDGKKVTEAVTELFTEEVTRTVEISPDTQKTKNINTKRETKTTITLTDKEKDEKTTCKQTTKADESAEETTTKPPVIAASREWLKTYGGTGNDKVVDIASAGASGYAALMLTASSDEDFEGHKATASTSYLTRFDSEGKRVWQCYLGPNTVNMYAVARLENGSFVCVGFCSAVEFDPDAADTSFSSVYIMVSADGDLLWRKTLTGNGVDYFTSVAATSDGGFVAGGKFASTNGALADCDIASIDGIVAKFDSSGELQWINNVTGSKVESVNSVSVDGDGNIYAAGVTNSTDKDGSGNNGGNDAFAAKFSPSGEKLWVTLVGGSKTETAEDIYAGSSGCVICGSYLSTDGTFSVNRGGYDSYLCFINSEGKIGWVHTYGGLKNDNVYSIARTSFGYSLVGSSASSNRDMEKLGKGGYDAFIMSVSTDGSLQNVKAVGGSNNDSFSCITKLTGKKFLVGGNSYSSDGDLSGLKAGGEQCNAVMGLYSIY